MEMDIQRYLRQLGEQKLEELLKEYFKKNSEIYIRGIDEHEFYNDFGYNGSVIIVHQILRRCGFYVQKIIQPYTRYKQHLLIPFNYEKQAEWQDIYDNRFKPSELKLYEVE